MNPTPAPRNAAEKALHSVEVRRLSHAFGQRENAITVLDGVDLSLRKGEMVVLAGPSGSGKTTLLTLIGCLRSIQSGEIELLGEPMAHADAMGLAAMRRHLGFVFQNHNLHRSLTARENVRLGLEVLGPSAMSNWREDCAHALAMFGLEHRADAWPDKLSGGQRQRVAIARAIVRNPALILADEPTAALDKDNGKLVVEIFRDLADHRRTTILMVTHDHRIMDYADRVVHMEEGRLTAGKT